MKRRAVLLSSIVVLLALTATACRFGAAEAPQALEDQINSRVEALLQEQLGTLAEQIPLPQTQAEAAPSVAPIEPGLLAAYESTLTEIYDRVNPSVVSIRVVQPGSGALLQGLPEMPNIPGLPEIPSDPNAPQLPESQPFAQGMGSGFVWDEKGNIVTNNHVVEAANKIEVTFSDGTTVPAELIGTDPDSDLAVIRVDVDADQLQPVTMGDSTNVRVGQLAIAIGNPFGQEGTMTVGIISALGRLLPTNEFSLDGRPSYSIPEVIQTDAPINPGNSGGVLVDDQGAVIGVTAAIESPVRANSGVGYVIPASIVQRVVPQLISEGKVVHPYLGISGIGLTPDLATAMDLEATQRGALVAEVVPDGPADKAGLVGSDRQVTIDGQPVNVGGDVIVAIDGQTVNEMDDLIAYLFTQTEVGQQVSLTVLRDGREQDVNVALEARPGSQQQTSAAETAPESAPQEPAPQSGRTYLGIVALPLNAEIAAAMNLDENQQGVLIQEIEANSPAEEAGLRGSSENADFGGQQILIGGDVITALDGQEVADVQELASLIQEAGPGTEVTLTILRDGEQMEVQATLAERPQ
jgi:S1-C subfamily serine protease